MVRLEFVRSDLLLWSNDRRDAAAAQRCTGFSMTLNFMRRCLQPDWLILGVGQHFLNVLARLDGGMSFTRESLNHTFQAAATARLQAFGHSPSTIIVVTPTQPIPFCSRYSAPVFPGRALTPDEATALAAASTSPTFASNWALVPTVSSITVEAAASAGLPVLDLTAVSAQRPDGSMATEQRRQRLKAAGTTHGEAAEDCVHSCMPGPVDTYAALLLEMLLRGRLRGDHSQPTSQSTSPMTTPSPPLTKGDAEGAVEAISDDDAGAGALKKNEQGELLRWNAIQRQQMLAAAAYRSDRNSAPSPPLLDAGQASGFFALPLWQWLDTYHNKANVTKYSELLLECSCSGRRPNCSSWQVTQLRWRGGCGCCTDPTGYLGGSEWWPFRSLSLTYYLERRAGNMTKLDQASSVLSFCIGDRDRDFPALVRGLEAHYTLDGHVPLHAQAPRRNFSLNISLPNTALIDIHGLKWLH